MLEPPILIKGRALPATGIRESITLMLIKASIAIQMVMPLASNLPSRSGARLAISNPRHRRAMYRPMTVVAPIRPVSSVITAEDTVCPGYLQASVFGDRVADADPKQSAAADGLNGTLNLFRGRADITQTADEKGDAVHLSGNEDNQIANGRGHDDQEENLAQVTASKEEQQSAEDEYGQYRAGIRLDEDQSADNPNDRDHGDETEGENCSGHLCAASSQTAR